MKRIRLLLSACALMISAFANAQTDVTSTYLTNANFEEGTPMSVNIHTYNKDITGSNVAQMQNVDNWTIVTNGDARAAGVFTYGDGLFVGGSGYTTPTTNPDGGTSGNALGMVAVWSASLQYTQEVTLPAGHYTLTFPVYNSVGGTTNINTNLFGFKENGGTTHYATNKTFTVNSWTTMTVSFDLTATTTGTISLGYTAANSGSGNMPHLFVDKVTITYTDPLKASKDALQAEIDKAKLCDAKEGLADAISTAEGVLASATTASELEAALAALQAADKDAVLRYENGLADATYSAPVVTSFVVNGTFDSGINPWQRTGTYQNNKTANNQQGAFTGNFYENWNGSAQVNKMYQTISNIPNGTYRLDIAAFVNTLADPNESQYVFANNDKTYLTTGDPTAYEVYTVVTNNQVEIGLEQTTATANWMGIDNVSLRYYGAGDVIDDAKNASHKLAWEEAKAAAEAAVANGDYTNVTGSEKTALQAEIAKDEPSTAEGYDAATAALISTTSAFTAAKANYDGLVAMRTAGGAYTTVAWPRAAAAKKTALDNAIAAAEPTNADDAVTKTNAIVTAYRQFVESNGLAEGVDEAVDFTNTYLAGADPATNTGWTDGIGTDWRSQEIYTKGNGEQGDRYYDGGWSTSAAVNINMTRELTLPAGQYQLQITARGSANLTSYTMSIGGETVNLPIEGSDAATGTFGHGWSDKYVVFNSDGTNPLTLAIAATSTEYQQWISFNRLRLVKLDATLATSEDYEALNTAIASAEAKTLGFETGQYAPYNNVASMELLAAAKAIDQTINNVQGDVQAATTALTGATWTANVSDVDAIYNGMYATVAEGQNYPDGWTRTNPWGQMQSGISGDYETAYYNQPGSLQYGNQGVYTMPLAANTIYKLTFAYRSHENNSNTGVTASVLYGEDGLAATLFERNGSTSEWKVVTKRFKTGDAGNYVLTLANGGNTWMTNVSIVKDENCIAESDTWIPKAQTSDITLTRTLSADYWNTFSVPFNAAIPSGWTVKEFDSNDVNIINFRNAESIVAGKPYLVKPTADVTNPTFNGVTVVETEGSIDGAGAYKFAAQIYNKSLATQIENGTIAYLSSTDFDDDGYQKIKKLTSGGIKGLRAYFIIPASANANANEARIHFMEEGETTGIESIDNGQLIMDNGAVYDLQGRKVQNPKRGMYIINGKKVIVK